MASEVESYYKMIAGKCSGSQTVLGSSVEGNLAQVLTQDEARKIRSEVFPDVTSSIYDNGEVCYLSTEATYGGSVNPMYVFMRPQQVSIQEKPMRQLRTTFDGIYAGLYGGGLVHISITGITHLWSSKRLYGASTQVPPNIEIDTLHVLMNTLVNKRGATFNFHDGFRARKWKVIPDAFNSVKSVNPNNLESYEISFVGAAFNQNFGHIDSGGGNLSRWDGPIARYPIRQIL